MDFVKGGGCRKSLKVLKIDLSTISLENEQFCSHGHSSDESKTSISMADQKKTRGPRGPWVAHLRKRSKVTVEPIIESPRGII